MIKHVWRLLRIQAYRQLLLILPKLYLSYYFSPVLTICELMHSSLFVQNTHEKKESS